MRSNRIIVIFGTAVVVLAGALMFMIGRSGNDTSGTIPARQAQAPVAQHPTEAAAPAATAAQAPAQPRQAAEENGTTPAAATSIPAAFLGEWNTSLKECGTGLGDSRVRVEPGRVLFHESEAEAKRVTIHDPHSITIEGPFQGEGESWNGRLRMHLSASGQALTIGDLVRRRCPS